MHVFLVNPIAGKGQALKKFHQLQKDPYFPKDKMEIYFTVGPGDAERYVSTLIKKNSVADISLLTVIGGDGTMHEVANGLCGVQLPVHYIKGGSGNDFSRGLHSLDENQSTYFTGNYIVDGKERKFVNCVGFGFDALVARLANESRLKRLLNVLRLGRVVYVIALIRALFTYKMSSMTIQVDEKVYTFDQVLFAVINNHPYFGGGMKINPLAKNEDQYMSLIVIDGIPKWKVLSLFITVFFGTHLRFKGVSTFRGKKIDIHASEPLCFQVDGEVSEGIGATVFKKGDFFPIYVSCQSEED